MFIDEHEISTLINGNLTNDLSMLDVMNECEVITDLNIIDIEMCRSLIKQKT